MTCFRNCLALDTVQNLAPSLFLSICTFLLFFTEGTCRHDESLLQYLARSFQWPQVRAPFFSLHRHLIALSLPFQWLRWLASLRDLATFFQSNHDILTDGCSIAPCNITASRLSVIRTQQGTTPAILPGLLLPYPQFSCAGLC